MKKQTSNVCEKAENCKKKFHGQDNGMDSGHERGWPGRLRRVKPSMGERTSQQTQKQDALWCWDCHQTASARIELNAQTINLTFPYQFYVVISLIIHSSLI